MRRFFLALPLLLGVMAPAQSQVSVGIGVSVPGVSIGINLPAYPQLAPVPGYPVYYDPRGSANYFFYDGVYWVYRDDNWYASSWYNGPWQMVAYDAVPLFVLRVPVRYYRQPPVYFRGWRPDAPPRWGEHWGHGWEASHPNWDHWDRRTAPRPAPLPVYQRKYPNSRYPGEAEQQRAIRSQNYHYQPREPVAQQHYQPPGRPDEPHGPGRPRGHDDKERDRRDDPRGQERR